jgi:hypothetical protein
MCFDFSNIKIDHVILDRVLKNYGFLKNKEDYSMDYVRVLKYVFQFTDEIECEKLRLDTINLLTDWNDGVVGSTLVATQIINLVTTPGYDPLEKHSSYTHRRFAQFIMHHEDFEPKPKELIIHMMPFIDRFRRGATYLPRLEDEVSEVDNLLRLEVRNTLLPYYQAWILDCYSDTFDIKGYKIKVKITHTKTTTTHVHMDVAILVIEHAEYTPNDIKMLLEAKDEEHRKTKGEGYNLSALYHHIRKEL